MFVASRFSLSGVPARWPLLMFLLLSAGCAHQRPAEQKGAPAVANGPELRGRTREQQAQLDACHAAAREQAPGLSVRTVALYFSRGERIVFADVELPEHPRLAACLSDVIESWPAPLATQGDEVASGGMVIELGPAAAQPPAPPKLAAVHERLRRVTQEALARGALRQSDPQVQELLHPPPAWPGPAQLRELAPCYEEARARQPDLVIHREVTFLERDGRILIADVQIPERPELARCLAGRMEGWATPATSSNTIVSGFFLDLGAAPEFPDATSTLERERERRTALFRRAIERKLITPDDPVQRVFGLGVQAEGMPRDTP